MTTYVCIIDYARGMEWCGTYHIERGSAQYHVNRLNRETETKSRARWVPVRGRGAE